MQENPTPNPAELDSRRIDIDSLTPSEIVAELDRYIIGQNDAKRAVAVAIRNRVRRRLLSEELREDVYPKNIIMIGPTGCGKTEIARRLARIAGAPLVKVEATKYTEVGYVGRDVESMVRDLVANAVTLVEREFRESVEEQARKNSVERLLDLLLPKSGTARDSKRGGGGEQSMPYQRIEEAFRSALGQAAQHGIEEERTAEEEVHDQDEVERHEKLRHWMREKLEAGEIEDREVEVEVSGSSSPMVQVFSGQNTEDLDMQMQNMFGDLMPKKRKKRRVKVSEARKIMLEEELDRLVDPEKVKSEAIRRSEEMGIIFLDELDKVCGRGSAGGGGHGGPDISREGVQRDLLPIVEGATVQTRYGSVRTDHVLFIAAGAFHMSKPSDLIPELQGRFPVRVELEKLGEEEFYSILTSTRHSLPEQYRALLESEGVTLHFTEEGLREIASVAFRVNEETENIGARRLHTVVEKLLEEVSFLAPDRLGDSREVVIDADFVRHRLERLVENRDLSHYIL